MNLVRTRPVRTVRPVLDPFDAFDRMLQQMSTGPYADRHESAGAPYDLYETDEALVLEMAVPGVAADMLDVGIEGRQLTVRAEIPEPDDEGRRYWTRNVPRGAISRTVKLPASVDVDGVHATARDGVLTLTLPKAQEAKVRKIDVVRDA